MISAGTPSQSTGSLPQWLPSVTLSPPSCCKLGPGVLHQPVAAMRIRPGWSKPSPSMQTIETVAQSSRVWPILSLHVAQVERPAADEAGEELGPRRVDGEVAGALLRNVPADLARVGDERASASLSSIAAPVVACAAAARRGPARSRAGATACGSTPNSPVVKLPGAEGLVELLPLGLAATAAASSVVLAGATSPRRNIAAQAGMWTSRGVSLLMSKKLSIRRGSKFALWQ